MSDIIIFSEGQGRWCEHFLKHVLQRNIIFSTDKPCDPQLIVRSCFLYQEPICNKKLPYITWSGEPIGVPDKDYPPLFKIWEPNEASNVFNIPFLVVIFFDYQATFNLKYDFSDMRVYKNNPRPNFLAYCASSPVQIREQLFHLLKTKWPEKEPHGLGRCQTTHKTDGTFHDMRFIYSSYRFAFAMENSAQPFYVTEKLFNVLLSGAIPIYYGDHKWVKQVFNEKCIIFVQDFSSLEACAEYIVHVDNTPSLLQQYLDEPRFIKDVSWFTDHPDYTKMREIILNSF